MNLSNELFIESVDLKMFQIIGPDWTYIYPALDDMLAELHNNPTEELRNEIKKELERILPGWNLGI